jgi:hypothetical protein
MWKKYGRSSPDTNDNTNGACALHAGYLEIFLIVSRSILLRMKNVSDRFVKKTKTHVLCSRTLQENRAFLKITRKKYGRAREAIDDDKIWRMRFSGRITEATNKNQNM